MRRERQQQTQPERDIYTSVVLASPFLPFAPIPAPVIDAALPLFLLLSLQSPCSMAVAADVSDLQLPGKTLVPICRYLQGPKRPIVLAGGPGTGKLTAVKQVAAALKRTVRVDFLETMVKGDIDKWPLFHAMHGTDLFGADVLVVKGAELISPSALASLMGRPDTDFGVHCLLLTSSKLQGVPADRLLYQPRPSQDFCQDLARTLGAKAPEVVCITAAGDLRQLRTLVAQDKAATGDGRGKTDQMPHTYFDTCRVLGGDLKIPEERVDFDWVEANLLDGVPDHRLDEARRA